MPSQPKFKMNRVYDDQETSKTKGSSEECKVHNVGRYSNDPVYAQMMINGNSQAWKWILRQKSPSFRRKLGKRFPEEKL